MHSVKRFALTVLITLSLIMCTFPVMADERLNNEAAETAKYLLAQTPKPSISSTGGDWAVIGIKRSPLDVADSYYTNYLKRCSEILSSGEDLGRKYTEYSRLAIAVSELGENAFCFGSSGTNLFTYINDYDSVVRQGINGPIFALEAKKCCGDSDTAVRDKYIDYIVNRQNSDGSFGLSPSVPDTDITAMAICAMCLYSDVFPNLDKVINKAFLYLSSVQQTDGGFYENASDTEINCESTAQVIIAMKRFGLKEDDGFFTKNGNTPYTALRKFRCSNGAYKHKQTDTTENQMATEQALLALTAETNGSSKMLIYDSIWFYANIKYLESIN